MAPPSRPSPMVGSSPLARSRWLASLLVTCGAAPALPPRRTAHAPAAEARSTQRVQSPTGSAEAPESRRDRRPDRRAQLRDPVDQLLQLSQRAGTRPRSRSATGCCYTIQSVWGGPRTSIGTPRASNGKHPDRHLVLRRLGRSPRHWSPRASAASACRSCGRQGATPSHTPWQLAAQAPGRRGSTAGLPARPGHRTASPAQCRGACRGSGRHRRTRSTSCSTTSAPQHIRTTIIFQTSMNLTYMAYQGQWNQAQVSHSPAVVRRLPGIFRQARLGRPRGAAPTTSRRSARSSTTSSRARRPPRRRTR